MPHPDAAPIDTGPDAGFDAGGPDCQRDGCTGFTYCDRTTGACNPGCGDDLQCGTNERCNQATHACECAVGSHDCNGACVADDDPATCGARCTACPGAANATAGCDQGACTLVCDSEFHDCNGACVADDDVATCGTRCQACPSAPRGTPACDRGRCILECDANYHDCGGYCASNNSLMSCGLRCSACPEVTNSNATCDGTSCGIQCFVGHQLCAGLCAECPGGPGVSASQCVGSTCRATACTAGYELCGGDCSACPAGPGVVSSLCAQNRCVANACLGGYELCEGDCASCPSLGVTAVRCDGAACVAATCADGFRRCGGACCAIAWGILSGSVAELIGDQVIDVDAADRPNVVYGRAGIAPSLLHSVLDSGGVWQTELVDPGALVRGIAMVATDDDTYHVAYVDGASQELRYVRRDPVTGWSTPQRVASQITGTRTPVDISVDINGHRHIAVGRDTSTLYARSSTSAWTVDTAVTTGGSVAGIAVTFDGAPHVVFIDLPTQRLLHATSGPQGWFVPFSRGGSEWLASARTPDQQFHVVHDFTDQLLRTTMDVAGSWTSAPIATVGVGGGTVALTVDPAGELQYLYTTAAAAGLDLLYRRLDAGVWRTSVLRSEPSATASGVRPAIALDSIGQAHFVYWLDGTLYYGH